MKKNYVRPDIDVLNMDDGGPFMHLVSWGTDDEKYGDIDTGTDGNGTVPPDEWDPDAPPGQGTMPYSGPWD